MKSLALLAPLILVLVAPRSFAGDIKLTFSGTVFTVGGTPPAPFQSAVAGDPITITVEVFDMPFGLPGTAFYPCDGTATSLQVGAATSALVPTTPYCTEIQFDTVFGTDNLTFDSQLPSSLGLAQAYWGDDQGTSMSGFLNQNYGSYPVGANPTPQMTVAWISPISQISGNLELLTVEASGGPLQATNYCSTNPNSTGMPATTSATGSASVAAQDLTLIAVGMPANVNGIFYYGTGQIAPPFGDGFRCVGGVIQRLPFNSSDATGTMTQLDVFALPMPNLPIAPGTLNFQAWYRDTASMMSGFNLSDGLSILFTP